MWIPLLFTCWSAARRFGLPAAAPDEVAAAAARGRHGPRVDRMSPTPDTPFWVRALVAAIVVMMAGTLLAGAVVVGVSTDSSLVSEAAQGQQQETRPEGAGPVATGDPEFDAAVADIATFVEQERGLVFQEPVTVEVLDDEAFNARLFAAVEKDAEQTTKQAQALQALGFVDAVTQIEEGQRALLEAGVLGFYDPETDELVVRGGELSPMTRQTIAHELTHALDDQWFDLDNPKYEETDDEVGFGLTALAEGNAKRIDEAYADELSDADRETLEREQQAIPPVPASVPLVLLSLIRAPYDEGTPLVESLLRHGNQRRLDSAFREPPTTSEQVLDPKKYLAAEGAVAVDTPPADGPVLDQGMFGDLMLRLLMGSALGSGRVQRAAEGWAGDRYVVWQQGEDYCLRVDIATDTEKDGTELDNALADTAAALPNAQVEQAGDRVRFTTCN